MNSNQSHIKELISTTTIYGLSIFLNRSAGFLLLPLYTYYLSPQEMGLFNLMQSIWLFIILIYMYGMETSFIKFFIETDSE
jgi:O-antigen/teichoic acid export membrane protein